jgi:hypothetical protein
MKKLFMVLGASALLSTTAFAGPNIGCGLGTHLMGEQGTIVLQVIAATTNGSSGTQTFGISSGTLGCKAPAKFAGSEKVNTFVQANLDLLAIDIAKGSGETLNSLAELMEVSDVDAFSQKLQSNFAVIFPTADVEYAQVVDSIYASTI